MSRPNIPTLLVMALVNVAFVALIVLGIIAFIRWFELPAPTQKRLLIQPTAERAVVPWRMFALCPVARRNVPTLPDDRRA
jgi:hypothetical protein